MTLADFIAKYQGRTPDFDGSYPGQCVDLYRLYCQEVLGIPQSPAVSGAAQLWTTANPTVVVRIPNTILAVPKAGDIVIFAPWRGNPYGHVCIALAGGTIWKFPCFEANWSRPKLATLGSHGYLNPRVLGWLRKR